MSDQPQPPACPKCVGDVPMAWVACVECDGDGGPECPECDGFGVIGNGDDDCPCCGGDDEECWNCDGDGGWWSCPVHGAPPFTVKLKEVRDV